MAALSGGIRDRMILESVIQAVTADLTARNWFDPGRSHAPINITSVFPKTDEEPVVNTLAIGLGNYLGEQTGLGESSEERFTIYDINFWGESRAITMQLMGDVWAFLWNASVIPIRDYSDAGDPVEFYAQIDESSMRLETERASRAYDKFWASLTFGVWDFRV